MIPAARFAASIDLLSLLEAEPRRPADAIAHDYFRARRFIGGGDRRAVADRVWAVVRQRLRLAWWLAEAGASKPTPRLLAAAQLLIGEGAAWNTLLGLLGGGIHAAATLTAAEVAVLRPLVGKPAIDPAMPDPVRLNLPEWALPGLAARFGASLPTEAAAMELAAPLDLRANLLKTSRAEAQRALAAEGIPTVQTELSPWGLRARGRAPVTAGAAYRSGLVEVQDEGSQMVALLTDARPGMRVCDYCAGAAGKTLAIAAAMGNRGRITACDTSAPRLEGAEKRLRRAGVDNAERHLLAPGDRWAKRRAGQFDRVLVDAPCTGTGTWRRNPDARWRLGEDDLRELSSVQREILDRAAELVRPGGRLVYATCSLLPAEDEAQVEAFLERHPDFAVLPLADVWREAGRPAPPPGPGPYLLLTPAMHGTDGFFTAVLRRVEAAA